ncbi:3-alpha-hydroxysteroid dehydrogenase [Acidocella aquatica]|uniref:3-alpha-hydroxysteroid dehydrogenase n=1 Tax=Acidocella aquatica TaxID=1922313 RepID=A0ABQ6A7Z2_9PROT|nr:SDR family oxidoreductase [Acidocella aquatica]GLR68575.1 3-alpha-hydroxysteroid dehydrogenase [Acidocella aquatica]
MGKLDGKVVLITGSAGGIGAATAKLFASQGAHLVLADVAPLPAAPDLLTLHLDVTDEAGWTAAIDQAVKRFGRLDVLMNNAGIFKMAPLEETSVAMFEQTVRINQLGVFLGMRAAAPVMKAQGAGSIINVSSVGGLVGSPNNIAYSGTKWAVRGMTKCAATELAPFKVRVNSIHPGGVDTPMLTAQFQGAALAGVAAGTPLGRLATAEDVAAMALFLASDDSSYSTGSEFVCDGGMSMA